MLLQAALAHTDESEAMNLNQRKDQTHHMQVAMHCVSPQHTCSCIVDFNTKGALNQTPVLLMFHPYNEDGKQRWKHKVGCFSSSLSCFYSPLKAES